jgi:hypothetical protein
VADTGPPWNIPYAEPTDLVRDWPALSEDVAEAVADGLDEAAIIKQVVSTTKTDTFSTTSTSFASVTGLTANITPSSATNKVLVIATYVLSASATQIGVQVRLMRDSTAIYVGDSAGSRIQASGARLVENNLTAGFDITPNTNVFLDSPGVATSTTYSLEMRTSSGTGFLGRSGWDGNDDRVPRLPSSITLIEVAA